MKCSRCQNLIGNPQEMVRLYVKNQPSRMNQNQEDFKPVGWICPQCRKTEVKL